MHGFDEDVFSKRIQAGRRVYFIDVKQSQSGNYYIAITESVKDDGDDESSYKRFRLIVCPEDFNKFMSGLTEAIDYTKTRLMPDYNYSKFDSQTAFASNGVHQYNREMVKEHQPKASSIRDKLAVDNI